MKNNNLSALCLFVLLTLFSVQSYAGTLIIQNNSNQPIICKTGNTRASYEHVEIAPAKSLHLSPNLQNGLSIIDWVKCGRLEHNNIGVTATSSDHFFLYNNQAEDVLSVLLYPYIPTYPFGDFSTLLKKLVTEFQAQSPKISLNAVMSESPEYDVYTYANFAKLLGKDGFDIVETDTMLLAYLVESGFILPIDAASTSNFWPAAIEAASYKDKLYGIPSWMCMEFLYARDPKIAEITSLFTLVDYLNNLPQDRTRLIGVFNGSWTIPPLYLNAYTALYGYKDIEKIPYQQPTNEVVKNLVYLTDQCVYNKENKCTNGFYHDLNEGKIPKLFAQKNSHAYIGFSEHSFYMRLFDKTPFYAAPVPFGKEINTLTYTDAYVKNAVRCNTDSCTAAFKAFTDYMSKLETRQWIVYSKDLPTDMPPRRLLPAIRKFYDKTSDDYPDGIYENFAKIAPNVRASPHISKDRKAQFNIEICKIIKTISPDYHCSTS